MGLAMNPSLQHRGGAKRRVETSSGRFRAKRSARDWVSRRDFSGKREGTGLLAVLRPFFEKITTEDPESCRYDVGGWERLPSHRGPGSSWSAKTKRSSRWAGEELALRVPAVKIARTRSGRCRGRFAFKTHTTY